MTLDTKEAQRVLGEWRGKKEKAADGPWAIAKENPRSDGLRLLVRIYNGKHYGVGRMTGNTETAKLDDAIFIAHARNTPIEDHLAAALDEVERLRAGIKKALDVANVSLSLGLAVKELHRLIEYTGEDAEKAWDASMPKKEKP